MELTRRKQEILKEVIDSYIITGEPVGSKAIMEKLRTPCSSATIRNEMNDLEKMGFLEQPHTSAGRIPTSRGYRTYVNSLMEDYRLSFEETLLLNSLLSDPLKETDRILGDMASLLSLLTGYAVVAFAGEQYGTIERFEGVYVNSRSFLLVMITSSGKTLTKQLQVQIPLTPKAVSFIIEVMSEHLAKKELGGVTLERMLAMEESLGEYRSLTGPLIQIIYDAVARIGQENLFVKGLANLLAYPEFSQPEQAQRLVRELEDKELLLSRFRQDFPSGLRVHIATGEAGLDGASFVICPFRFRQGLKGAVCIIGPKRMDYGKVVARLEYLAKQINAVHGFEPQMPLIEPKKDK